MKRRNLQNVIFGALLAGGALWGCLSLSPHLLSRIVDEDALRISIEKGLRESMGVRFRIESLTLEPTLFHELQVHLNTNAITDERGHPLGSIRNISIAIRYWPLLTKLTPEIAKIHLNHVDVPIRDYNLFKSLKIRRIAPERNGLLQPAELRDTEVLLTDYGIEDFKPDRIARAIMPGAARVRLEGPELSIRHLESARPIALIGKGRMLFRAFTEQKHPLWQGNYDFQAELTPTAFNEEHPMRPTDLKRLMLALKSRSSRGEGSNERTDLKAEYRQQSVHQSRLLLRMKAFDLAHAQAVTLQLANMFGIRAPLPLRQTRFFGRMTAASRLRFDPEPRARENSPQNNFSSLNSLSGSIRLSDVGLLPDKSMAIPRVQGLNGCLLLHGGSLSAENLTFRLGGLPFHLQGRYRLSDGWMNLMLLGENLRLDSLHVLAKELGAPIESVKGREAQGVLTVKARFAGTAQKPAYAGELHVREGLFEDAVLGARLERLEGALRFTGEGFRHPRLAYEGRLVVLKGRVISPDKLWAIRALDGNVAFQGHWMADQQVQALPQANGVIHFSQGEAHLPDGALRAEDVQGRLRLERERFLLEDVRARMADARHVSGTSPLIRLSGESSLDLRQYQLHLQARQLALSQLASSFSNTRLSNARTSSIPAILPDSPLSRLRVENGQGDLDIILSTGLQIRGKADVSALRIRAKGSPYLLQASRLLFAFDGTGATLAPTTLTYGPVPSGNGQYGMIPLRVAGRFSPLTADGAYEFRLAANAVPLSLLRDAQGTLAALSGARWPEIWNTAGFLDIQAALSNRAHHLDARFHDVGLSWQDGDFPISGLNGALSLDWTAGGRPRLTTQDLAFVYGNSPVRVNAQSGEQLLLLADGVLSALTVNHFLVSHQSEATPYRDVPFRVRIAGSPDIPLYTVNRDLRASLHLDLNETLKGASQDAGQPVPSSTLPAATEPMGGFAQRLNRRDSGLTLNPVRLAREAIRRARFFLWNSLDTLADTFRGKRTSVARRDEPPEKTVSEGIIGQNSIESPHGTIALPIEPPEPVQLQANVDDTACLDAFFHWTRGDFILEDAILHLFGAGDIRADGIFRQPGKTGGGGLQAHVRTVPAIALTSLGQATGRNSLFRDASGLLAANLQLTAENPSGLPQLNGWLTADHIVIPELQAENVTGRVNFTGQSAVAEIAALEIPGVKAQASARTDNLFEMPITLEDVDIRASLLDIAGLTKFNNYIVKPVIIDRLVHNYLRPWQLGDPFLPIQFRNGSLRSDELIYQNILMNRLQSRFSVYANGFYEMDDARVEAAGGTASGYLSMNPHDSNFTTLELYVENVKANALTKALLNVTNQIFGDLSGTVRFTTFGETDDDMQRNANGAVTLRVKNGRLPAIAKVETLLTTANLIRGGILGLNLNNLFRTLIFYDTNYFAELSGNLLINNQVLYTHNLISDGVNLDLLMQGSLRMDSGDADMTVNGRMSQNVAGRLGFLGQLSLGRLLRLIPGLGTFGGSQAGLFGYLPGIGYIPGFGGPASATNRFQVRLKGPLDEPATIRDFHWVHTRPGGERS